MTIEWINVDTIPPHEDGDYAVCCSAPNWCEDDWVDLAKYSRDVGWHSFGVEISHPSRVRYYAKLPEFRLPAKINYPKPIRCVSCCKLDNGRIVEYDVADLRDDGVRDIKSRNPKYYKYLGQGVDYSTNGRLETNGRKGYFWKDKGVL